MRFVIFDEDGVLVAVCLEHYIVAQSIDMEELKRRLQTTYRAERDDSVARTGVLFSNIPPAPEQYQRMWDDNDPDITRGTIVDKDEMRLAA